MSVDFTQDSENVIKSLRKGGAFLTVKYKDKKNTMTIGWGEIGFTWGIPVFTIYVRHSRYSHDLIEKSNEFTVSVPFDDKFKKALAFCGTKSGRDVDKFVECNLNLKDSETIETPYIDGCDADYECKVIYKNEINPKDFDKDLNSKIYGDNDYHTIYYGQILKIHRK